MSWSTEEKARKAGEEVLGMMHSKKWKIRVWENLGWHVSLNRKFMSLGIRNYKGDDNLAFSVLVSLDDKYVETGETYWSDNVGPYGDPNRAVEGAIITVREFVRKANACLKEIESN